MELLQNKASKKYFWGCKEETDSPCIVPRAVIFLLLQLKREERLRRHFKGRKDEVAQRNGTHITHSRPIAL